MSDPYREINDAYNRAGNVDFRAENDRLREYISKKEWSQTAESLRMRSALTQISRNASVMTAHQIETMARDALTKEG